jgi:6-phosphofructokinase
MRRKMMDIEILECCARKVDVIVHINEHLDKNHRAHIENVMGRETGVLQARFNAQRHHLMIVAYDPKQINSAMILNHIRHQNVNAQLVGGI